MVVAVEPADFDEYLDAMIATVAKYFAENPDEYYAEVIVPEALAEQYSEEEVEQYLAWLPELLEPSLGECCTASYDAGAREIRVDRP